MCVHTAALWYPTPQPRSRPPAHAPPQPRTTPQLPKAVQRLVASALGPLLGDSDRPLAATAAGAAAAGGGRRGAAPAAAARPGGPGAAAAAAGGGAAGGDVAPSAPGLPPPSPEAVQQLVAMGFSEGEAARALQLANNDVQAAIGLLL